MAIITFTTDPPVDPTTPTPTHYQVMADEVQAAVDVLATALPKLEQALAADEAAARRNLNVPDLFCYTAINAVEQLPELNAATNLDLARLRNQLQFIEAFRPVWDKFETVSRRLSHALRANKSAVATSALLILRVAKAQGSLRRSPGVAVHIEAMQRDLGRRTQTRTQREERKAQRLQEEVEKVLAARALAGKEVQAPIVV